MFVNPHAPELEERLYILYRVGAYTQSEALIVQVTSLAAAGL